LGDALLIGLRLSESIGRSLAIEKYHEQFLQLLSPCRYHSYTMRNNAAVFLGDKNNDSYRN
jgi:hypothetical protein